MINTQITHNRMERKFLVSGVRTKDILNIIKINPGIFREIYSPRIVNNIYFDTYDNDFLDQSIVGVTPRTKVRIRWYHNQRGIINNPVLELKIKQGLSVKKLHYDLLPFSLDAEFSMHNIKNILNESNVPKDILIKLNSLKFSLLNSYLRHYFISEDTNIRLTIDEKLNFSKIMTFNNFQFNDICLKNTVIVELKYDSIFENEAQKISNNFPFRLSRSSKYVMGMQIVNG